MGTSAEGWYLARDESEGGRWKLRHWLGRYWRKQLLPAEEVKKRVSQIIAEQNIQKAAGLAMEQETPFGGIDSSTPVASSSSLRGGPP